MASKHNIKDAIELAVSRAGECLSGTYIDNRTKLLWKCTDGHSWEASYSNVQSGRWCPYCSGRYNEEKCRFVFERLTGRRFPKDRVAIGQELDGYNADIHVAFEYNGKQHYEYCKHFHKSHDALHERMRKDRYKSELCKQQGIRLIVIPYWVSGNDLVSFILDQIKDHAVCQSVAFDDFFVTSSRMFKLNALAASRGGKCLSDVYVHSEADLEWECSKGHRWMTTANVVKSGSWCPHCAGRCKSIVDMQQLAASKNGTCLSHEYKGNRHKLEWACEYGHRWFAVPHSISDGSWCPRCASTKNSERARKHNYDEGVDLYLAGRSVVYVAEQLHIDMYGLWREINRKGLVRRDTANVGRFSRCRPMLQA